MENKEKRTNMVKIMMSDSEKENVTEIVNELKEKGYQKNITSSDLIRQSIDKWISMYRKIEQGNSICYLPISDEFTVNQEVLVDINKLVKSENLSEQTLKVLGRVVQSLEWEALIQLQNKYPNRDELYDLYHSDIDV